MPLLHAGWLTTRCDHVGNGEVMLTAEIDIHRIEPQLAPTVKLKPAGTLETRGLGMAVTPAAWWEWPPCGISVGEFYAGMSPENVTSLSTHRAPPPPTQSGLLA